ncbi:MAG TPA: hypothetical protein VIT44_01385 [Cyclobacteriaceae bacterium]
MEKHQLNKVTSIEKNIEEVKQLRDTRIRSLMRNPDLMNFLEEHYNTFAISPVKLEFLKRDFKELLQSPLDLVYYSAPIRQIKDSGYEMKDCFALIDSELKKIIEKYGFEKFKPF